MTHGHCQLESGFFVLRVCGKQATGQCTTCMKVYCRQHSADTFGTGLCIDCARERGETVPDDDDHLSQRDRYSREHSRPWSIGNRHHRDHHANDQSTMGAAAFTAAEAAEFEKAEPQSITDADGDNASDFDLESDDGDISIFDS